MTPPQAKRVLQMLSSQIEAYEKAFGAIRAPEPPRPIGFQPQGQSPRQSGS